MHTLNQHILSLPKDRQDEFWKDCIDAFSSGSGARVLEFLASFRHPLVSPVASEPHLTYLHAGQHDIISALWRHSQPEILPQDIPQPTPQP